jgi:heme/copper-type cytochrome/quinol oxidase subunit 3
MNFRKRHLFHILEQSSWPILIGWSVFLSVTSIAYYLHDINTNLIFVALFIFIFSFFSWVIDVLSESTKEGEHTIVVQKGLSFGFILFILSEIMLFFGFFWTFFNNSISPSILIGAIYPPIGIEIIPIFLFPLYNTFLLLLSGITVTWLHKALNLGSYKEAIDSFILTIILGLLFFILQVYEYYESTYSYNSSVYGSIFFMLTGLHGFHVVVGILYLMFGFIRLISNHFTINHHNSIIYAIWYWHFVDIVWILLYLSIYLWGSWS